LKRLMSSSLRSSSLLERRLFSNPCAEIRKNLPTPSSPKRPSSIWRQPLRSLVSASQLVVPFSDFRRPTACASGRGHREGWPKACRIDMCNPHIHFSKTNTHVLCGYRTTQRFRTVRLDESFIRGERPAFGEQAPVGFRARALFVLVRRCLLTR
jgi:hypothetical protein